mgnify:CR=1 FL=1
MDPMTKAVHKDEQNRDRAIRWKEGKLGYLQCLISQQGDRNVGTDPKSIACYLRLQAAQAYRDGLFELSAHISAAAFAINQDARTSHMPDWTYAKKPLKRCQYVRINPTLAVTGAHRVPLQPARL